MRGESALEELRAVNWKNINWSEFRDTICKNPGVGSSGFFRSIAQEVTNGFSGCGQKDLAQQCFATAPTSSSKLPAP